MALTPPQQAKPTYSMRHRVFFGEGGNISHTMQDDAWRFVSHNATEVVSHKLKHVASVTETSHILDSIMTTNWDAEITW
jgi:hypothetical protein